MSSVCITGANRGIGLEFVKHYGANHYKVFAVCRNPKDAVDLAEFAKDHSNVFVLKCDVSDFEQIKELAKSLKNESLDILINNAGVYGNPNQKTNAIDANDFMKVMHINAMAPAQVAQELLGLIEKGQKKVIANITSRMGSIEDNTSGGSYLYRASKTALNSISKTMQMELKPLGIQVLALHPGWVKTRMGGSGALITAAESAKMMSQIIETAHSKDGLFYHCNGEPLPY